MCDRNCFECIYEDCIQDEMTYSEYLESKDRDRLEKNISYKYKWNLKHPEVIKKAKKKYHQKNLEAENARNLNYYYENRQSILERGRTDYMKEYKREYMRRWRAKQKALREENQDVTKTD